MSDTSSSWASRLAAAWERAESTVTRLFLFGVFVVGLVAQFVKPVGDALQDKVYLGGALLTVVGYVLYAEVQRLNAGHSAQRVTEAELQAVVEELKSGVQRLNDVLCPSGVLPTKLEAQFQEVLEKGGEVRLSVLGFTGETFADPLVQRILPQLTPGVARTIQLRVLVPDFTKEIEVPGRVGADGKADDAPRFRESLVGQIENHERRLKDQARRMESNDRGRLSVEFRVLHMSPSLKLYFINDDVVYEGIYDKIEKVEPNGSGGQLLDPQGYDSLLTRWASNGGDEARKIIDRRRELFDTLWDSARAFTTEMPGTAPVRPEVS
ncbi:ATP/GTP-binding protein [Streptomyces sp. R28]|uniref:ATP/GTP-binding protein n=1 Tax=Streptomyces sp. R28 TaxID=3238628 RepID=A0AB39Q189_9ACTN